MRHTQSSASADAGIRINWRGKRVQRACNDRYAARTGQFLDRSAGRWQVGLYTTIIITFMRGGWCAPLRGGVLAALCAAWSQCRIDFVDGHRRTLGLA